MRVNLSNSSLQNRYFSGTGSIGGIHLPDFNDKYVFSKKKSGISDEEYRKQIREQAYEDFSGKSKKLNGGYAMPGATWTMGAMFAQTSGLPLSISIDDNAMDTQDTFFKDTTTLGDILQKEGYSQTLLIGSDATFGGRRLYFEKSHAKNPQDQD